MYICSKLENMGLKTLSGPRTRLTAKEIRKINEAIESYVTCHNFCNQFNLPHTSLWKIHTGTSDTCSKDLATRLREIIKQVG